MNREANHHNLVPPFASGKSLHILIALLALTACAAAQNINGTIQITKKLTSRRVTPSVSIYQRGPAVALGQDANEDSAGI
jgi:hypothetical protein